MTVPVDVLAWLVRAEGLGELHVVLAPAARWIPRTARNELESRYREEVRARFGTDEDALGSLAVLCRATSEFYGWISVGGTAIGVLAAAIGGEAMLAVREGDSVWLSQVRRSVLAEALVAQTPEVPAARAQSVTVDLTEVLATSAGQQPTASGVSLRQASQQVRLVKQITEWDTTGCGEFYVAVRDGMGRRIGVSQPLCYADTVRGRFMNYVTGTGSAARITVAPACRSHLTARLEEMHRSLVR